MLITDAKKTVGQFVEVEYESRQGNILVEGAEVFDVNFIALYGPCLITDKGDFRLDRIRSLKPVDLRNTA